MTAVEHFVQALQQRGVQWIATLCGHGLDPLYAAAKKAGIRLVDTRNEQSAAYMAEAYARLTRKPGVVAASSGVAHVNALTGVMNAWFDGSPVLLISGAGALATAGMGHFQDADQAALAAPITKYSRVIDAPERAIEILDEAWQAATTAPPGPVHLTFPMDIQRAEVAPLALVRPAPPAHPVTAAPAHVEYAADLLAAAQRPLIVTGSGVYYSGQAARLTSFCELYSIPFVIPIWDRGCVDQPMDSFMGVTGAATGGPRLLADADVVVLAGAAADYRVGFAQPAALRSGATVVRLDSGYARLSEVYAKRHGKRHDEWCEEAASRRDAFREAVRAKAEPAAKTNGHALRIIDALEETLTGETILLIDGGSIGQWAHQLLTGRYPGHWLTCGRSGVVGWGIGGAMGARLAHLHRPVILLSGDGAFTFNAADLECAVRQRLPFVAIVADDQAWGITAEGHRQQYGEAISSTLGPVEFAALAISLGARGVRAESSQEIRDALREGLAGERVTVIHVPIAGGNPSAK